MGKRGPRDCADRVPRGRSRAARGLPGVAKTLIARSFAGVRHALQRIQFTPDLIPADITGSAVSTSARATSVPAGSALRQPAPRRRDQPGAAEDAGRAARGDGGAAGHDRGRDPSARPAVPRDRDAEPDRVGGHVPAARGAARPVHAAARSAIRNARTSGDARGPHRARARRWSSSGSSTGGRCRRCSGDRAGQRVRDVGSTSSRSSQRRDERPDRGGREPARVARAAQASRSAPRSSGATSSRRTTSRRSPCRRWPTAWCCDPSPGCAACAARTWSRPRSTRCRRRRPRTSARA